MVRTLLSIIKDTKENNKEKLSEILDLGLPCPIQRKKGDALYCDASAEFECDYASQFYMIVDKNGEIYMKRKCDYKAHIDYYDIALEIWKEGHES